MTEIKIPGRGTRKTTVCKLTGDVKGECYQTQVFDEKGRYLGTATVNVYDPPPAPPEVIQRNRKSLETVLSEIETQRWGCPMTAHLLD